MGAQYVRTKPGHCEDVDILAFRRLRVMRALDLSRCVELLVTSSALRAASRPRLLEFACTNAGHVSASNTYPKSFTDFVNRLDPRYPRAKRYEVSRCPSK